MNEIVHTMTETEARYYVDEIKSHVGKARVMLLELYEREGWRALGYSNWRECVTGEFGKGQSYMYYQLQAAQVERNISTMVENDNPIPERQLRPLASLPPEVQAEVYQRAIDTAPDGKITAAHVSDVVKDYKEEMFPINRCEVCGHLYSNELPSCPYCDKFKGMEVIEVERKRPVSYHVSDDSYDWYTPAEYIEAARGVMGSIDVDPASSYSANQVVLADTYYTKEDDGIVQPWYGNVWLNPPYNMPLIEQFTDKVIDLYKNRTINSAIVLTNNSTDTGWFHKLIQYPVCFTKGRIQFWNGDERLATRQGQAIFYLGDDPDLFATVFSVFGIVLRRYDNSKLG